MEFFDNEEENDNDFVVKQVSRLIDMPINCFR